MWWIHFNQHKGIFAFITISEPSSEISQVFETNHCGRKVNHTQSMSWLLMPWLLTSPGRQQPWYSVKYSWWRNQMETFSVTLAICAGNSPVPQRPVTRRMFSWICVWINNREASDLRRYRAHYDVTVMFLPEYPSPRLSAPAGFIWLSLLLWLLLTSRLSPWK